MSSHDAALKPAIWRSDSADRATALALISRHFAAVDRVYFVQPHELHLPSTLRRTTEALGPITFGLDTPSRLPAELIDGVHSVAAVHPLEAWYVVAKTSALVRDLRGSYIEDLPASTEGWPDIAEELRTLLTGIDRDQLLVGFPYEDDRVVVVGDATVELPSAAPGLCARDAAAIEREVRELHDAFAGWFTGRLADNDAAFSRIELALRPEFQLVDPRGTHHSRADLIDLLRGAHGKSRDDDSFAIWIEGCTARSIGGRLAITTYDECQRSDGIETRRRSSAVVELGAADTATGVAWHHVHETWVD